MNEFNNNSNNNEKKFKITDLITNKQYNAILNLALGFGTIIILIIMIRLSGSSVPNNTNDNINNNGTQSVVSGFNDIKGKNFSFKYTLLENGKSVVYQGKERENKILFTDATNKLEYYVIGDVVSVKKGNDYVIGTNPSKYFNYFDVELVEKIISSAKVDEDDYVISINDFSKVVSSDKSAEGDIYINLTKSNGIITKITFDLGEYAVLTDKNIKTSVLTLEYSNFNLIDDFDIKIN